MMKFTCSTAKLNQAIANVSLAVASKSTLPALQGILVTAKNNTLTLVGYNLELGITATLPAKVQEEGSLAIPSQTKFPSIVRQMAAESDEISISCEQNFRIKIRAGKAKYEILGMEPTEFPELPVVGDGESVTIPRNKLRSMIDQTLFAVAQSDSKPVHTGCLFLFEERQATVAAVDGFRLALRREPVQSTKAMRFVVPGRSLRELLKMLGDDDTEVELQISKKHILFTLGETTVISRLLEGEFLDYNAAIPKEYITAVRVPTQELLSCIEGTSLLISDRLKSPLRVVFEDGLIAMSCSTTIGNADNECGCEMTGPRVEMGFNNQYLIDALKNSEVDMVRLEISGPLSPMKVLPIEGDSFLFLVLPMKLRNG